MKQRVLLVSLLVCLLLLPVVHADETRINAPQAIQPKIAWVA